MNKKKKRIKIILISVIIVFVLILILRAVILNNQKYKKEYNSLEDFETVEEVVRYMEGKLIKEVDSESENFAKDIYINFKYDLYTNEKSNQFYYYTMINRISYVLEYDNFRMIDNEKELVIAVICNKDIKEFSIVYINGDSNYFGNMDSKNDLNSIQNVNITNMEIQANEILELEKYNWVPVKVNFGTKESTFDGYDIYFDEGIEIRKIYKKVFNIIFNENYTKNVINNINTNSSLEEVIDILGQPTFGTLSQELIGYKGNDIYVFFSPNTISVYPVEKDIDMSGFIQLSEKFEQDRNIRKFVSGITDIWKDYDIYSYDTNYVNLVYSLKGIKIQFNITKNNGVIFYNNFTGQIRNNLSIQDLKANIDKIPKYTFFEDVDSVYESEQNRIDNEYGYFEEYYVSLDGESEDLGTNMYDINKSNKFFISIRGSSNYYIRIISLDNKNINSEIKLNQNINSYLWLNDDSFVYSISGDGVYLYNAIIRQNKKLISGNGEYNIHSYKDNTLLYDNDKFEIEL